MTTPDNPMELKPCPAFHYIDCICKSELDRLKAPLEIFQKEQSHVDEMFRKCVELEEKLKQREGMLDKWIAEHDPATLKMSKEIYSLKAQMQQLKKENKLLKIDNEYVDGQKKALTEATKLIERLVEGLKEAKTAFDWEKETEPRVAIPNNADEIVEEVLKEASDFLKDKK